MIIFDNFGKKEKFAGKNRSFVMLTRQIIQRETNERRAKTKKVTEK